MDAYVGIAEALDTYTTEDLLKQGDRVEFRLCGIASNIARKYSKKDNRPWSPFTLSTRKSSIGLNMFADAFAAYGKHLVENAPVLVQGNIIVNQEGPRVNVKECYPLDVSVANMVKKVTFLLKPDHKDVPGFLHQLREILNKNSGDTRIEFAFVFEDRYAPLAEGSGALTWKVFGKTFQMLRKHPAVISVLVEAKHLELKQDRRWEKKR